MGITSVPLSAVYNALSDGTFTITVLPAYAGATPTAGLESLRINLADYADASGQHVTDGNDATLTFLVTSGSVKLATLGAQTVGPGTTLSYQVNAADTAPGGRLIFSLGQGAPAGAAINPTSGVFTWTPTTAQAGTTYSIPVIAAAATAPSINDTEMLSVTVFAPPTVKTVTQTDQKKGRKNLGVGTITLTFSEPMADSAGSSGYYSVVTPKVVRVKKKKQTELVPVAFKSQRISSTQVQIELTKPSKLALRLIVHDGVTSAQGVALGADVTMVL
jgi:hypothetical protein